MRLTDTFVVGDSVIEIALADITTADVDVIVNSICDRLHVGSGVSGAIASSGGSDAVLHQRHLAGAVPVPGDVFVSPAGRLPFRQILHAISSRCGGGSSREILESCTTRALELAREMSINSIAFPAMGTGEMGFGVREAAVTLINSVVQDSATNGGIDRIVFCLLEPNAFTAFFREAVRASIQAESLQEVAPSDRGAADPAASDTDALTAHLQSIPAGMDRWHDYETTAIDLFQTLFVPPLSEPRRQAKTESGLAIRDAVFPNPTENGFWSLLDRRYNARLIPFECKNYVDKIGQDPVNQLSRYLRSKALGNVGILSSRQEPSKKALVSRREAFRDLNQLILFISDFDFTQMAQLRRLTGNADQYLQRKIDDFTIEY